MYMNCERVGVCISSLFVYVCYMHVCNLYICKCVIVSLYIRFVTEIFI